MRWLVLAALLLCPLSASAQAPCTDGVCVEKADLDTFLQLARDQKCRAETAPTVTADGITIVTDRMGRVYGSGAGSKPFQVHMQWCNYQLDAKTTLNYVSAMRVEPAWGFRLRLKATLGVLPREWFRSGTQFHESLDGGVLVEPFYYQWANLNAFVGVRSIGLGLGVDLTKNVTLYGGYGLTWGSWTWGPQVALGFALW